MTFQMDLNPWVGCEGYAECERALELNGRQVLFECGHGRYWYLGDRVLPKLNMSILLPQFQLLLVTLFGWLTFWLIKRLLGLVTVILLQG